MCPAQAGYLPVTKALHSMLPQAPRKLALRMLPSIARVAHAWQLLLQLRTLPSCKATCSQPHQLHLVAAAAPAAHTIWLSPRRERTMRVVPLHSVPLHTSTATAPLACVNTAVAQAREHAAQFATAGPFAHALRPSSCHPGASTRCAICCTPCLLVIQGSSCTVRREPP